MELRTISLRLAVRSATVAALLLTVVVGTAGADTTGFKLPGLCTSVPTGAGALAWATPSNAQGDDNLVTQTGSLNDPNTPSEYLKCTNFGLAVPTGSLIDDISMQLDRKANASNPLVDDAHVYPVRSDNAAIGSVGTDRAKGCGTGNDWPTTNQPAVTYTDATDPKWGISNWGACAATSQTCPDGSFNVNHPNFGVAVAAKVCSPLSNRAQVDVAKVQVTYRLPCATTDPWGTPFTVTMPNHATLADTTYTITVNVPNKDVCALTAGSQLTLQFPADTDVSNVTSGTVNDKNFTTTTHASQIVAFTVPASALLQSCGGTACIQQNATLTIVLPNVKNPSIEAKANTLTIVAAPTLAGTTATSTSAPYLIAAPCTSSSNFGTITVTPDDNDAATTDDRNQSIAGCPKTTRYRLQTTIPAPLGCELVPGQTTLVVSAVSPNPADLSHVTTATVKGAIATTTAAGASSVNVAVPNGINVGNTQPIDIVLDVVQNPGAAMPAPTLKLQAVNTLDGGTTAATSSDPYTITATMTCSPTLDLFVRDWTVDATNHDVGNSPSGAPAGNWAHSSDVWNQYTTTPPLVPSDDWVRGKNPYNAGTNVAFARISLKGPTPHPVFGREVTAKYYWANWGSGANFALLDQKTFTVDSGTLPIFQNVTWPAGTISALNPPAHLCLAVEITSPSDPLTSPSLSVYTTPNATSRGYIEADNNQAQRNMELVSAPDPIPPPAPMHGGAGPMSHYAIAHNGANVTRDLTFRLDAPPEAVELLHDTKVEVVGSDGTMPLKPNATLTLPAMAPAEDRWISFTYTLASGGEGKLLPVSFSELYGDTRVSAFTFGIQPSRLDAVIPDNLHMHQAVFARLAALSGLGEGRSESQAAAKLRQAKAISEDQYVRFLKDHRRQIDGAVAKFIKGDRAGDPIGVAETLRQFDERVDSGHAVAAANGHLALLEKLDTLQTMRQLAKGNPNDVVQMVSWQKELYSTRPELTDLPEAADVVKQSQAFLDARAKNASTTADYAHLIASLTKDFQATAASLKKHGTDVAPQVSALARARKTDVAALEKAHREYLLALHAGSGHGPPSRGK